jgi:hypothetical protein
VEAGALARAYRDGVLAQGRELLNVDYAVLVRESAKDELAAEAAEVAVARNSVNVIGNKATSVNPTQDVHGTKLSGRTSSLSLGNLYRKLIGAPNPEFIQSLAEADIRGIQARCEQRLAQFKVLTLNANAYTAGAVAGVLCSFDFMDHSAVDVQSVWVARHIASVVLGALGGTFAVLVTWTVLRDMLGLDKTVRLVNALGPLNEDAFRCLASDGLLKASDSARAYRDIVVSKNRGLRVLDAGVFDVLAKQDEAASDAVMAQAACRQLHGV